MFKLFSYSVIFAIYISFCKSQAPPKMTNLTPKEMVIKEQVRVFIESVNSTFEKLDVLTKEEGSTIINIISDDSETDVLRAKEMIQILQDNYITKLDFSKQNQNPECIHHIKSKMLKNQQEYELRLDSCAKDNLEVVRNEIAEGLRYTNLSLDKGKLLGAKLTVCHNKPTFTQLMCYRSILVEMPSLKTDFHECIDVYKARFRRATMTLGKIDKCISKEIEDFKYKAQNLLREGLAC